MNAVFNHDFVPKPFNPDFIPGAKEARSDAVKENTKAEGDQAWSREHRATNLQVIYKRIKKERNLKTLRESGDYTYK